MKKEAPDGASFFHLNQRHALAKHVEYLCFELPGVEAIFNCGQAMYKGETILLCSICPVGEERPYIKVARSKDGINFKFDEKPLITMSEEFARYDTWVIDPRLTYFPEEDTYYIMRPASSDLGTAAILGKTKDFETYEDIEIIALPSNRVPCLFPRKDKWQLCPP